MHKYLLFCLSVCVVLFAPGSLRAAGVAVICHADIRPYRLAVEGFREKVALPLRVYYLGVKNEHRDDVDAAIRQQMPEVILALGKSALNFTRQISSDVPVVFAFVLHPEDHQRGLPEFGIEMLISPMQQFEMLLNIAPKTRSIGVIYDPLKSGTIIRQARAAAKITGLKLVAKAVANQEEAAHAIADVMTNEDAMWMIPDTTVLTSTTFKQMRRLSLTHSIALIGLASKHVREGSLFALSFDSRAVGLQAGEMASSLLNGERLSKLVSPDVVSLIINKQTAARLGLSIHASLLKKAKHVYPKRAGESH